jgi:hypothetical protein
MKPIRALLLAALLPGCAVLHRGEDRPTPRLRLWNDAQTAFYADSFRVATNRFQALADSFPRTVEGREAHFFLGVMFLDPRNPAFDPRISDEQLGIYLSPDTALHVMPYRRTEAISMQRMAQEFRKPCEDRVAPLRCETRVVERRGGREPARSVNGTSSAEVDRLQGIVADRDAQIQRLRDELERIRNTLVPRKP